MAISEREASRPNALSSAIRESQEFAGSGTVRDRVAYFRSVFEEKGILRDSPRQKKAEEDRALFQAEFFGAQKMAAVGELTCGVAHNFNNLLTAILGFSDLALGQISSNQDVRKYLQEIKQAAARAVVVTQGLLSFSGRGTGEFAILDLNEIVSNVETLLEQLISDDIETNCVLKPDLALIEGDRSHIEQVIVNMALNARDAMPDGGKLVIETAELDLAEPLVATGASLGAGRYVTLSICDTGIGMDEQTRLRIFEPFFTTKGADHGTGLGLSSAIGMVELVGGQILVDSRPGRGTTFTICLPASGDSSSVRPRPDSAR